MSLREWMDKQSEAYKEYQECLDFNEEISLCDQFHGGIHVHKGILKMADEVEAEIYIKSGRYIAFFYNGVEFFQKQL